MAADAHSVFSVIGCPCLLLFVCCCCCALTRSKSFLRASYGWSQINASGTLEFTHLRPTGQDAPSELQELPAIDGNVDNHGRSRKLGAGKHDHRTTKQTSGSTKISSAKNLSAAPATLQSYRRRSCWMFEVSFSSLMVLSSTSTRPEFSLKQ